MIIFEDVYMMLLVSFKLLDLQKRMERCIVGLVVQIFLLCPIHFLYLFLLSHSLQISNKLTVAISDKRKVIINLIRRVRQFLLNLHQTVGLEYIRLLNVSRNKSNIQQNGVTGPFFYYFYLISQIFQKVNLFLLKHPLMV